MNDHPQPGSTGAPASRRKARAHDDDYGRADMVIKAGVIHSMAQTRQRDARGYRAMAVRDGHIVALSAERDGADDLIGAGTVVVDDPGLTVLPACDDTHTHLIFAGRAANDVQVADAKDLGEFLGLIARRAASTPAGGVDPHRVELARAATG